MKIRICLILSYCVFAFAACESQSRAQTIVVKTSNIEHKKISVLGMTCVGCEVTLESTLKKIVGIVNVKASHSDKVVVVDYDKTKTNMAEITHAINEAGYKVTD